MVLDIEKYPEFVLVLDGKINDRKEGKDLLEIKGTWKSVKVLNETYSSLVVYHKNKDKILVTNLEVL